MEDKSFIALVLRMRKFQVKYQETNTKTSFKMKIRLEMKVDRELFKRRQFNLYEDGNKK